MVYLRHQPRRSQGRDAMRFGSLGPTELILIVLVLVLVFGASKLGDIGGALGKSVREFKQASQTDDAKPEDTSTTATSQTATPVASASAPAQPAGAQPVADFRPPDVKPS